ncbi:MAG: hypothetical protein Q9209_000958 [Squamulea sp. 1 TL-2023]
MLGPESGVLGPKIRTDIVQPGQRVDRRKHSEWAGDMKPSDCAKARALFGGRVDFYNPYWPINFWSRKWTVQPPGPHPFELPFGVRYRTCTLLMRMAKDYGDDVIFYRESPLHLARNPAESLFSWWEVLQLIDHLLEDVQSHDMPLWGLVDEAIVVFIPSSSAMSRRWATGMRSSWGNRMQVARTF